MLRRAYAGPHVIEVDAHPAVEATLFDQPDRQRLLVGLLNMQRQLPQVPVPAIVRVRVPAGKAIRTIWRVPDHTNMAFSHTGERVQFEVPPFDGIVMFICDMS